MSNTGHSPTETMTSTLHIERRRRRIRSLRRVCGLGLLGLIVTPPPVATQQVDPAARLAGRLSPDLEVAVLQRIEAATARSLPAGSLVDLALQGLVKARSGEEVLSALDRHLATLTMARDALGGPDERVPASEVEAAGLAIRMGADPDAVSAMARSRPAGRSLEIPLLVLGGLSQRGLPSDQALGQVMNRLADQAGDEALLATLPAVGIGRGPGSLPAQAVGPGGGAAGLSGPPSGLPVPVGPAGSRRPDAPPGRGRPDTPGSGGNPNPGG